jgi:DNA-binding MarR family transcriptional regulator
MSSISAVTDLAAKKPKTLREEIRQTKPFESPAQEAILGLYRTADVLQRTFAQLVEPRGISLQQYNVLRILRGAGKAGTATLEIAERMIEKTPGITRLLDKLEAKQLVRRERCPEDRRQVLCWITDRGLQLLGDLDKPLARTGAKAMEPLTVAELRSFISILERVRAPLT